MTRDWGGRGRGDSIKYPLPQRLVFRIGQQKVHDSLRETKGCDNKETERNATERSGPEQTRARKKRTALINKSARWYTV